MREKTHHSILIYLLLALSFQSKAQVAYIDLKNIKQSIDGFGASTAWHGRISETEASAAFSNSNSNQLGLSIIRVRIDPNSSYWPEEKANAQKAKDRGAIVFATPWSPPASMKTNNNVVGGELEASSYSDYAAHLKSFCDNLGNVDVISIQNEPNITVTYESCNWNASQIFNFCSTNAFTIGVPVMIPEAYNFDFTLSDPTLNDSAASSNITYIGGHLYGTSPKNYANAIAKGKKVWMTEHYYDNDDISTCLNFGKEILDCMTNNMSAYIYWYLRQPKCNLITSNGSILKKGYTLGQFSKFVRPGSKRVEATYQPQTGVFIAGFTGTQKVIVAVNRNSTPKSQTFTFQNDTVTAVIKYTTSSSKSIKTEDTITFSENSFTTTLDAQSITTFVSYIPSASTNILSSKVKINTEFQLYPNPVHKILFVENSKPNTHAFIYNINGKYLLSKQLDGNKIDLTNLSKGVYFINFSINGRLISRKIVKE